ncbi:hypothetical protein A0H81_02172 [Grifola frondosa]|uniref:Uncharacterized protein n=1 Tax=Grifola frondosa TaxID=5627 RepID=A0A1C7MS73_GRIFR|nr:hypothetical protein A0H81_03468 [Grifola frondosa]OBZ77794.1 hypothetical protein A0H81_02172 [Grifola frondosa]
MSALEVAHIVNVLTYTIRRLEDAVQREQEDVIKSARIAFASGLLWASDIATVGRDRVTRSVGVMTSTPELLDRSNTPVVMEIQPTEADDVERDTVSTEPGIRSVSTAASTTNSARVLLPSEVMESGYVEAEVVEPALEDVAFSDIEVIEAVLPEHIIDLSGDTGSESGRDSDTDELEVRGVILIVC